MASIIVSDTLSCESGGKCSEHNFEKNILATFCCQHFFLLLKKSFLREQKHVQELFHVLKNASGMTPIFELYILKKWEYCFTLEIPARF